MGWPAAALGSGALTDVTRSARLGPVVASATKPPGTFVYVAARADAVLERDRLDRVVERAVDVPKAVGDRDGREAGGVEREDEMRRARGSGALQRDDGVRDVELGERPRWRSVFGFVWFANLRGVEEPSARTVCGSTAVEPVSASPRYPTAGAAGPVHPP